MYTSTRTLEFFFQLQQQVSCCRVVACAAFVLYLVVHVYCVVYLCTLLYVR